LDALLHHGFKGAVDLMFGAGVEKDDLGRRGHDVVVKSVDEPTSPSDPGNDNMNTRLTIRPVLTAAALAAVIGMTSALSVAQAGEAGAQGTTMGAAGPYQPSPFVDYDNTWLTGTAASNADRAMGWR
jgi:hypothetical protein